MGKLIILRHGQSQWNLENRFTGWVDVPLTDNGKEEAENAGKKLIGLNIRKSYTSRLKRSIDTLKIILGIIGKNIGIEYSEALNERHYGKLQGMNKDEAKKLFGEEQVQLWRRSYDFSPPEGESLKDVIRRVVPFFKSKILPDLIAEKNILVVAHHNSLRGLVKHLENISDEDIVSLEIPLCVPLVYEFDNGRIVSKKYI